MVRGFIVLAIVLSLSLVDASEIKRVLEAVGDDCEKPSVEKHGKNYYVIHCENYGLPFNYKVAFGSFTGTGRDEAFVAYQSEYAHGYIYSFDNKKRYTYCEEISPNVTEGIDNFNTAKAKDGRDVLFATRYGVKGGFSYISKWFVLSAMKFRLVKSKQQGGFEYCVKEESLIDEGFYYYKETDEKGRVIKKEGDLNPNKKVGFKFINRGDVVIARLYNGQRVKEYHFDGVKVRRVR